jgi:RNA-directed DNA polymerase
MKIDNVFDEIFSMENLYGALFDASRGRRYERDVLRFNYDAWTNLRELRERILSGKYEIDRYNVFFIHEPKKRMIMSIGFEHRVVQWAIYRVVNPLLVKGYIKDSYGCIPGRGALGAMTRLRDWLSYVSRKKGEWYYLKLDISKYFYRVSHGVLKRILAEKIKDERLLKVLFDVIDCKHTPFGLPPGKSPEEVPLKDRLFDVGMPIGNLLSQMFANVYLNELDQYCKRNLGIKFYIRYMDDIIILNSSKGRLHEWRLHIGVFLCSELELTLNRKTCVRPINQGVEFVGYRLWYNRVNLRKSTTLGMKRSIKGVKAKYRDYEISAERAVQTFVSYIGMLQHTDSAALLAAFYANMVLTHSKSGLSNREFTK